MLSMEVMCCLSARISAAGSWPGSALVGVFWREPEVPETEPVVFKTENAGALATLAMTFSGLCSEPDSGLLSEVAPVRNSSPKPENLATSGRVGLVFFPLCAVE
jgi:hypothetical protein